MRAACGALLLTAGLLLAGLAFAQLAVPPLTARVTDQTATLDATQTAAIEKTLQEFEARKGSQIAVLIVPSNSRRGGVSRDPGIPGAAFSRG
jgi:uncharacterized protein